MLEKSFGLFFYLKHSKNQRKSTNYVYLRITVDGISRELSTKRMWEAASWDSRAGRAIGVKEDAKTLNNYLDTLITKVYQAKRELIELDKPLTAEAIKNVVTGKEEDKKMILEIFQHHNDQIKELTGSEYAPATLKRYKTALDHAHSFIKWKYDKEDLDIKKLNYEFISEYAFWLKSVRHCNQNTTVKYVSNLKKIVLKCVRKGWLQRDPFVDFKMSKKEVIRVALTEQELQAITRKSFPIERLNLVRDIFLFSCYTGPAYIDVKKLKRTEITTGIDGTLWITTRRQKTETPSRIPLLPLALKIMDEYKDHPQCRNQNKVFPVLSNQKMNAYLKEIADVCGINKNLTFHIARHTFATTVTLSNGVPIETVSKMLGHSSLKQTQHYDYAKILDIKISEDMRALREKLLH